MKFSQLLGHQIRKDPVAFSQTIYGKALTGAFNMVPSSYDTSEYVLSKSKDPVRIVFTGMGDSEKNDTSRDIFLRKYPVDTFIFGHKQLKDALKFANQIKDRPVIVYGHSWGSNAARLFADTYKGDIQQVHFLDPMRKEMTDAPVLQIKRDVPVTYTPAGKYKDQAFIQSLFDSLRWKPSQKMRLLKRVTNHSSVEQWLKGIDAPEQIRQSLPQGSRQLFDQGILNQANNNRQKRNLAWS